jgi:uncharacterized protein (TIGR03435 family)
MNCHTALLLLAACAAPAWAQSRAATTIEPSFEVATVQPSRPGTPDRDDITVDPGRLSAHGVSLKTLIYEAYKIPYSQIVGGPGWINDDQYDVEAKSEGPAGREQMERMLRTLLADRFKLAVHEDHRESRIWALVVNKGGPLIQPLKDGEEPPAKARAAGLHERYVCDMAQFAGILAIKLTIPFLDNPDPTIPSRQTGPMIPVQDETGLKGRYDFDVSLTPEPGGDSLAAWQRALQDQLGLKLVARRGPVTMLVIDRVERVRD